MKIPCTEEEQATLIHGLGHIHGDGWDKVLITGIEAYVVVDDDCRRVIQVVKTWPSNFGPTFVESSKKPVYQGKDI